MTLQIGVVGAGFIGRLHARVIAQHAGLSLGCVIDPDPGNGRTVAAEFEVPHFESVEAALEQSAASAYIVAVPDRLHVDVTCELLRAGVPVLLEKPMAHSLEAARVIDAASREGGARLMIGHILRFDARYALAAEAVARGEIGDVLHVRAGRLTSQAVGMRLRGNSSVVYYLGIHDADAVQWITGSRVVRVYSAAVTKLARSQGLPGEDAIFSTLTLADGSIGQLYDGWTRAESDAVVLDGRLEVVGTGGSIQIDVRDSGLQVVNGDGVRFWDATHWPEFSGRVRGDLEAEIAHFAQAVETGEVFAVSVGDAMRAVAVNDAILRSLRTGRPEEVEAVDVQ